MINILIALVNALLLVFHVSDVKKGDEHDRSEQL